MTVMGWIQSKGGAYTSGDVQETVARLAKQYASGLQYYSVPSAAIDAYPDDVSRAFMATEIIVTAAGDCFLRHVPARDQMILKFGRVK